MNRKHDNLKFIKVTDVDAAHKLRHEGFTEVPSSESGVFIFVNDETKLTFDVEKYNAVYTNILCI